MRQLAIFTILILLSLHVQNQDLTNSVTSSVTNLPVQSTQTPPSISNQNAGTIEQSQQLSPPINNNVFPFSFSIDLN
jgi:hypothetical protein